MAVADSQIEEILNVLQSFLNDEDLERFFDALMEVEAYKRNKSFRHTVMKLDWARRNL